MLPLEASFPLQGSPWFPGNQIASEHRWQGRGLWSMECGYEICMDAKILEDALSEELQIFLDD